jgi:hypothetical protein
MVQSAGYLTGFLAYHIVFLNFTHHTFTQPASYLFRK